MHNENPSPDFVLHFTLKATTRRQKGPRRGREKTQPPRTTNLLRTLAVSQRAFVHIFDRINYRATKMPPKAGTMWRCEGHPAPSRPPLLTHLLTTTTHSPGSQLQQPLWEQRQRGWKLRPETRREIALERLAWLIRRGRPSTWKASKCANNTVFLINHVGPFLDAKGATTDNSLSHLSAD